MKGCGYIEGQPGHRRWIEEYAGAATVLHHTHTCWDAYVNGEQGMHANEESMARHTGSLYSITQQTFTAGT